jgi:hypothetical protein
VPALFLTTLRIRLLSWVSLVRITAPVPLLETLEKDYSKEYPGGEAEMRLEKHIFRSQMVGAVTEEPTI